MPQGSVVGLLLFSIYTAPSEAILKNHGVFYHKFADDLQIYVFFNPGDPADRARAVNQMQDCTSEICSWMAVNKLKLNPWKQSLLYYLLLQYLYNICILS